MVGVVLFSGHRVRHDLGMKQSTAALLHTAVVVHAHLTRVHGDTDASCSGCKGCVLHCSTGLAGFCSEQHVYLHHTPTNVHTHVHTFPVDFSMLHNDECVWKEQ